jgi:transcription initiation factor TFIIH subunit 1
MPERLLSVLTTCLQDMTSKLREAATISTSENGKRKWGTNLAVGQSDLASTFETERGRLLGLRDIHPPNADEDKNARVVRKYNRHWAMVLHPDEAVAGSDLMNVSRKSVTQVLEGDEDSKAHGGVISEMKRLVNFANADQLDANHVTGAGLDDEDYASLNLNNVEAYSFRNDYNAQASNETKEDAEKRRKVFAHQMAQEIQQLVQRTKNGGSMITEKQCFPESKWGRNSLSHLTERMAEDAKTEEDCHDAVNRLDGEFKKKLDTVFSTILRTVTTFLWSSKTARKAK